MNKIGCENIEEAISVLKGGGYVAFPTEASYIIGVKEMENALTIYSNLSKALSEINLGPIGRILANKLWPGPLILKSGKKFITVSSYPCTKKLIDGMEGKLSAIYLGNAATLDDLLSLVRRSLYSLSLAIDDGEVKFRKGYTVVKVEGYAYRMLIEGSIPFDLIERIIREGMV